MTLIQVDGHGSLPGRLMAAIERAAAPERNSPSDPGTLFSETFVRRHTEFESFDAFCRACPCERDSLGGVQALPASERNEFVAGTTDFETWPAMRRAAATTDVLTLLRA